MGVIISPVAYDDWELISAGSISNPATSASVERIGTEPTRTWSFTNGEVLGLFPRQIPHTYKEGTDLIPHIHWLASTTEQYTGVWTFSTNSWLSVDGLMQAAVNVTQTFDVAATANQSIIADFNAVWTGVNRKISSVIAGTLTLTLTAGTRCHLLGLDAHYQRDGFGSVTPTSKT